LISLKLKLDLITQRRFLFSSHLKEAKDRYENKQDKDKIFLWQQLQKWHKELEETEKINAREDCEYREEIRPKI
jgi:hypothetical protein